MILGLKFLPSHIGWAVVKPANDGACDGSIVAAGADKIEYDNFAFINQKKEVSTKCKAEENFSKGFTVSPNLVRRGCRSTRRRIDHYQRRRAELLKLFKENGFITDADHLCESDSVAFKDLYRLRALAVSEPVSLNDLARILLAINKSRGYKSNRKTDGEDTEYLQEITARSNMIAERGITVGQYYHEILEDESRKVITNLSFYRADYYNEFERIWSQQCRHHPELTYRLKRQVRHIIFHQEHVSGKKGEVAFCPFESHQVTVNGKIYTTGSRACPLSSPLFQEFRLWQRLNDVVIKSKNGDDPRFLTLAEKRLLASELTFRKSMSGKEVLTMLYGCDAGTVSMNFSKLIGNETYARLYKACLSIVGLDEKEDISFEDFINSFTSHGYRADVFTNESLLYDLWYLIYSYPGDESKSGMDSLIARIRKMFAFDDDDQAVILAKTKFEEGYGSLSSKAIKKLLPHLKQGYQYSTACRMCGYEIIHPAAVSISIDKVEHIPHNSLRSPLVEKVLNRAISIVNSLMEKYGRFDEIHIELSRMLACDAAKRAKIYKNIEEATKNIESCRQELIDKLRERGKNVSYVNSNDVLKYRLYKELEHNDYRTLYSNTPIDLVELIFGKTFQKEHIVPKDMVYSDAYSQLTLEVSEINSKKSNSTAYDYILKEYGEEYLKAYKKRVMDLYKKKAISEQKKINLLLSAEEVTAGAKGRNFAVTGYITKKARDIFKNATNSILVSFPAVTRRLCDDWTLNIAMREQAIKDLKPLGLTEELINRHGEKVTCLKPGVWSPEKDHRTFAMQAIVIAFTTAGQINYLNALNTRSMDRDQFFRMRNKYLIMDPERNWIFRPPIAFDCIANEVINILKKIFVTRQKRYDRVMTTTTKKLGGTVVRQLIPRGSLHEDTYYRKVGFQEMYKIGKTFNREMIEKVVVDKYREALLRRLDEFGGDAAKAFTGKNVLKKNPVWLDECHLNYVPETVLCKAVNEVYTQRIKVNPKLNVKRAAKIIDKKVKEVVMKRLAQYDNNPKVAFSNLKDDPLWLNQKKGIKITSVRIQVNFPYSAPFSLRTNKAGKPIDYVQGGNNSHSDFYADENGKIYETVVSYYSAVRKTLDKKPLTDPASDGRKYLFSLRRGEYFIIPDNDFNPDDIDIEDDQYRQVVSNHLYVLAKISKKYYVFRRHNLYTGFEDKNSEIRINKLDDLIGLVKVSVDNLGSIRIIEKLAK